MRTSRKGPRDLQQFCKPVGSYTTSFEWRTMVLFSGQSWKHVSRLNAASHADMLVCTRLLTLNYMSIFLLI